MVRSRTYRPVTRNAEIAQLYALSQSIVQAFFFLALIFIKARTWWVVSKQTVSCLNLLLRSGAYKVLRLHRSKMKSWFLRGEETQRTREKSLTGKEQTLNSTHAWIPEEMELRPEERKSNASVYQPRGVLQEKLGAGVRPPIYPIHDQNLRRHSLPYLWPDQL